MLQATQTPLSAMDPATMRAVFNQLAAERGAPPAPKTADRMELGKGIALLRATSKPKAKPAPARRNAVVERETVRPSVIRDCALIELARVVAYQHMDTGEILSAAVYEAGNDDSDKWLTVGATYAEVAVEVRRQIPKSRISSSVLRRFAHHVRSVVALDARDEPIDPSLEAFRNVLLPERRPKERRTKAYGRPDQVIKPENRTGRGRAENVHAKHGPKRRKKHGAKRRAT